MKKGLNERQNKIVELVYEKDYVAVKALGEILNVSLVTIRKDLDFLEQNGILYRTHGGASKKERFAFEKSISEKELIETKAKQTIANKAYKFIKPNDFVMLASGTTVLSLARQISATDKLTALTSSLGVAIELSGLKDIEVIQLGGVVRKSSMSIVGTIAQNIIKDFCFNTLFLGVDGIDLDFGLSTSNIEEAELNRVMIKYSDRVVVLADSTKMEKKGFSKIVGLDEVDIIITDNRISSSFKKAIEEIGIKLIITELTNREII